MTQFNGFAMLCSAITLVAACVWALYRWLDDHDTDEEQPLDAPPAPLMWQPAKMRDPEAALREERASLLMQLREAREREADARQWVGVLVVLLSLAVVMAAWGWFV